MLSNSTIKINFLLLLIHVDFQKNILGLFYHFTISLPSFQFLRKTKPRIRLVRCQNTKHRKLKGGSNSALDHKNQMQKKYFKKIKLSRKYNSKNIPLKEWRSSAFPWANEQVGRLQWPFWYNKHSFVLYSFFTTIFDWRNKTFERKLGSIEP